MFAVSSLNDYRSIAVTPILMRHFEELVLQHSGNNIHTSLDPHQFEFRTKRSIMDAISTALLSAFTHFEENNSSIRKLFVDFSSAFNTISSMKLTVKLKELSNYIDFLAFDGLAGCHWNEMFLRVFIFHFH